MPTLGQRWANVDATVNAVWDCCSFFCFVFFLFVSNWLFVFVASPVSDTILSDYKWAKFNFAVLLYVRTRQ